MGDIDFHPSISDKDLKYGEKCWVAAEQRVVGHEDRTLLIKREVRRGILCDRAVGRIFEPRPLCAVGVQERDPAWRLECDIKLAGLAEG